MSGQVSLYLRNNHVVIIPQGGGGGYTWDVEPSLIVPSEPAAIASAIDEALGTSRRAQGGHPPPKTRSSSSPLLKRLGFRSYKEFYRGSSYCFVYEEDGDLVILAFKPSRDGHGFDLSTDPPKVIKDSSSIGSIVLTCLEHAPKMASS